MSAFRIWNSILSQFGQTISLSGEHGTVSVRAFFQPVPEKAPGTVPSPLGLAPAGTYLYFGPAEQPLDRVSELLWNGRAFRLLRNREYRVGDELAYRWAVCEELDQKEEPQ